MVKIGEIEVENFKTPYVIAEIASNHNGDMKIAEKLIIEAKKAGADAVKFQSWSKDTVFARKVYEDNCFLKDDYRKRTDYTLEQIVKKFSISEQQLIEMKKIADSVGIDCISTPFSKKEVDFLVNSLNVPCIKVASMDLNNYPFIEYIAKKGKPVVISTGLSELHEIDMAIRTIENAGNDQISILHCVSIYPPDDEQVNLNNMDTLRNLYPYPVGFSDHTLGVSIPLAAVAKGACIIEKHLTLDKGMFGWDHKISATPDELAIICREAKRINKALGTYRIMCEEDVERKSAFRRSLVAARDIMKGALVSIEDIDYKRPGTGIPPGDIRYVAGRRLKKSVNKDDLLAWEDFE